jgi:hypothetical protein
MNKHSYWIIGSIILLLIAINAQAYYFTIQLHNGNELNTAQYWETGDAISFYSRSGTVTLPKTMVKNIMKVDGVLESESVYQTPEISTELNDEEYPSALPWDDAPRGAERTEEFIADLRDRLSIINANIDNLTRNREMFLRQREGYEQDRERAQERINEINSESLLSTSDRADRIQLENAKINDAETKMARVDDQLRNNARLVDTQNTMKVRLERELESLTR